MHPKHLTTLEFPKVLARLAEHTSFSASAELARALTPAQTLMEARERLETTSEARSLWETSGGISIGGARDVRPLVEATQRAVVLTPLELLDIRDTLLAAHRLQRFLAQRRSEYPRLAVIAGRLSPCPEITEAIGHCIDERGEVRDDASPELATLRREARIANERIRDRLQSIIASPANAAFLQEPIITQREGRYVIPVKADFKGRIPGIVHDLSASGATIFVEPLAVVELNNAWRELQLREQQEVHRILSRLSNLIAAHALEISTTVHTLAELDLAFAKARYAQALNAVPPQLVPFKENRNPVSGAEKDALAQNPGATVRLLGARHPLLDPNKVVPIDIVLDNDTFIVVITGPNTGGKTVALKTVGLLTLMAMAGLHIPAQSGSALSPFAAVYADIGDEQSIEQNLSTFSAHLSNIVSFIETADAHSLVLLDELGAGTDPTEGAALARAILEHFRARGVTTFVATHYPELKSYAQLTPGVCNAAVEFDPDTLSPTYQLTMGLPGRSNALAIAQRLGLPQPIIEAARRFISPSEVRVEDMLSDIHRLRIQAARARDGANAARQEAEQLANELRRRLATIEQERQAVLEEARGEAERLIESLRVEIRALRRRLQAIAASVEPISEIEEKLDEMTEELKALSPSETEWPNISPLPPLEEGPLQPGDTVWVQPLSTEGRILQLDGDEAEVQVGPARMRVGLTHLELRRRAATAEAIETIKRDKALFRPREASSPGMKLDLRGNTVEEALDRLDRYLDAAVRAELPWVHIIHGKGTGVLRRAVREFLAHHPLVSSYEAGSEAEGGDGVTIVHLIQE